MNDSHDADFLTSRSSPVFFDPVGRRRRYLRRAGYVVSVVCLGYAMIVAISLVGGPITPRMLLPGPDHPAHPGPSGPVQLDPSSDARSHPDPAPTGTAAVAATPAATQPTPRPRPPSRTERVAQPSVTRPAPTHSRLQPNPVEHVRDPAGGSAHQHNAGDTSRGDEAVQPTVDPGSTDADQGTGQKDGTTDSANPERSTPAPSSSEADQKDGTNDSPPVNPTS